MIIRALRPDRVTAAVEQFVEETLGTKYVDPVRLLPFQDTFKSQSLEEGVDSRLLNCGGVL